MKEEMVIHIRHSSTETDLVNGKLVESEPTVSESYMVGHMIRYRDETTLIYPEGAPGMMTILHFPSGREKVTIRRSGPNHIILNIEVGKRSISYFETAVGSVALGVSGQKISADFTDEGGTGLFRYQMDTNLKLMGTHEFQVTARRREKQ